MIKNKTVNCLFVIILVMLFHCSNGLCDRYSYIITKNFIPLRVNEDNNFEENHIFDIEGIINPQFQYMIHTSLTNGDFIISGDISDRRILLLLENHEKKKYIQVAVWDWISEEYVITSSQPLPENTFIDTFHDGNDVLLSIGYGADDYTQLEDIEDFLWYYFTVECCDNNEWIITHFTDGYSFTATYSNGLFVLRDYETDEVIRFAEYNAALSTFDFNHFAYFE